MRKGLFPCPDGVRGETEQRSYEDPKSMPRVPTYANCCRPAESEVTALGNAPMGQ